MKKVLPMILSIIIIGLLIVYFIPKESTFQHDPFTADIANLSSFENFNCGCIGFLETPWNLSKSDALVKTCYGIPVYCTYSCMTKINVTWYNISCEYMD